MPRPETTLFVSEKSCIHWDQTYPRRQWRRGSKINQKAIRDIVVGRRTELPTYDDENDGPTPFIDYDVLLSADTFIINTEGTHRHRFAGRRTFVHW